MADNPATARAGHDDGCRDVRDEARAVQPLDVLLQRVRAPRRLPRRWQGDKLGRIVKLSDRITRLEDRFRPAPHYDDPITMAALDLLTDGELNEVGGLFRTHGAEWTADLPQDAQGRVLALLVGAKARAVQLENPATAGAAELAD